MFLCARRTTPNTGIFCSLSRGARGVVIVTLTDFLQLLSTELSAVSLVVSDIPSKLYFTHNRLVDSRVILEMKIEVHYEKIKIGNCFGPESHPGIACRSKYGFRSGTFSWFHRRNVAGRTTFPDRSNRLCSRTGARFSIKKQAQPIHRRAAKELTNVVSGPLCDLNVDGKPDNPIHRKYVHYIINVYKYFRFNLRIG